MIGKADGKNVMELDQKQIMEIIPHRPPMLLVDQVRELVPGDRCVSTFYVDPAREIFKGHFPGQPVAPGVCLLGLVKEALAAVDLEWAEEPTWYTSTTRYQATTESSTTQCSLSS